MTAPDPQTIDFAIRKATECGALQSIQTEQTYVEDRGITFLVRWASSLASKELARKTQAPGPRAPRNPFLPPEADLTVAAVGDGHLLVLNKYPVIEGHLLIVTREFEDQTAALTHTDFAALAEVMSHLGGLGFYNGGTLAGASQRHKHLQWIPESPQSDCLRAMTAGLPRQPEPLAVVRHPGLAWRHAFIRLAGGHDRHPSAAQLQSAFDLACARCGIGAVAGHMPPYNLLANDEWLLVVPRSVEHCEGVSINALGFAGSMFVRRPEDIETVRRIGPLNMLAAVAT